MKNFATGILYCNGKYYMGLDECTGHLCPLSIATSTTIPSRNELLKMVSNSIPDMTPNDYVGFSHVCSFELNDMVEEYLYSFYVVAIAELPTHTNYVETVNSVNGLYDVHGYLKFSDLGDAILAMLPKRNEIITLDVSQTFAEDNKGLEAVT
jgi:hypothetical protein